jgi:hypothetical protein
LRAVTVKEGMAAAKSLSRKGASTVPPLVMGMQTGSTNNHISQIFFVLAAPM